MSRKGNYVAVGADRVHGDFAMGFRHLTSLDVGRIQPLCVQECVTHDHIKLNMAELNITCAPNVAPIQGRFKCHVAAFYVRNRVVFDGFDSYISGMSNVGIPAFDLREVGNANYGIEGSQLTDRYAYLSGMGLPLGRPYEKRNSADATISLKASILPFRGYRRIWWDWFRNPMVIPDNRESSYIHKSSIVAREISEYLDPHYANWSRDFLTNTLRTPNGDTRTTATGSSYEDNVNMRGAASGIGNIGSLSPNPTALGTSQSLSGMDASHSAMSSSIGGSGSNVNNIQALRTANAIQKWLEKCSAIGGRLKDRLMGMFGSSVSYQTLGMSEILGYTNFDIHFETEAANQSTSMGGEEPEYNAFGTTDPAVATMKGQLTGKSTLTTNGLGNVNYHCQEHGYFFILTWITPDVMLYDGLAPHWFRGVEGVAPSRFDFLTDEFTGTGFDPLYMYEIINPKMPTGSSAMGTYDPFAAIGYRGKFENYKYNKDIISGCFEDPRYAASMRSWWLGRDLQREHGLVDANGNWISGKTGTDLMNNVTYDTLSPITRSTKQAYDDKFVVSDPQVDHFVCQAKIDLTMQRPLPSISAPRIETAVAPPKQVGGTMLA